MSQKGPPKGMINRLGLRVRLTLWYVLLMGLTLCLFSGFLYVRLQATMLNSIDVQLSVAVSQAVATLDDEDGEPAFEDPDYALVGSTGFKHSDFALLLFRSDGSLQGGLGDYEEVPPVVSLSLDYVTLEGDESSWRVHTRPIKQGQRVMGWLQVAHSLSLVDETLASMRYQLLLGLPLVLLLAGAVGIFLADRALRPITAITRTAQEIGASDLARRIEYQGAADEVGRLANTFDHMLERLQQAFLKERRFTADAAHELRTPLTVLKGKIEVALSRRREKIEYYEQKLYDLGEHVDRLIRLSSDLLMLSRFDQLGNEDQQQKLSERVNLTDTLHATADFMQPLAEEKSQTVSLDLPPTLILHGDEDNLVRLFLNLVENAIKYTPAGGQISVQAETNNHEIRVAIQDTGPGIPPEHIPHLFERFYRVDNDRSRATGGSGLGLSLAHQIAQQHQGRIEVQSTVGEGSIFTVYLPTKVAK